MAVVVSEGSLVTTHTDVMRPTIPRPGFSLYGGRVVEYADLYRLQPNLRLVIRFLARNIAQLGIGAYRRLDEDQREPLPFDHPLRAFLRNPTPSLPIPTSRHAWIRGLVEDLALYDLLFVLKLRNPATPAKLNGIRIPPTMMTPIGDSWLWPEGFRIEGNRGRQDYDAGAVIYMHGHNPSDPRVGLSSVESLRRILAEEAASGEWREQYWNNAARMSGVVTRPAEAPKWSDPARLRWQEEWKAMRTGNGPDAGATVVLEEGMKFEGASFSARDSEYLGARRLTREETAAAYFIPPVFVGILENANYANIKEQHIGLYADTLGPWIDWLSEELELQLVPEFPDTTDVYLEFNIEEKLRGRFEEQAQAMQTATGAPWLLRNEARALRNLPPVEGFDDPVTPLNVLIGGQASPTDSAPPSTGTASRRAPAKARNGTLPRYLNGWHAKHVEVLSGFFGRQRSTVLSKLGAGLDLDEAFDVNRWNEELGRDLLALSSSMAEDLGGTVAGDFGSDFDLDRALPWLAENARIAAEGVNASTLLALQEVWTGAPRTGAASRKSIEEALRELDLDLAEDDLEDPLAGEGFLDPAREVFDLALSARVAAIATSRATSVGQWSRREGAQQAGARSKIWVSSGSPNSRHDALDGETVPIGEPFSNGGQWPGDPALGVDEVAGCLCSLEFGQ